MSRPSPLSFRLPPDLHAAVETMAANAGITTSEWVRDMLQRIVYGQPPGIDEGYMQGRALGFRVVSLLLARAWEGVPQNVDDAMALITLGQPPREG